MQFITRPLLKWPRPETKKRTRGNYSRDYSRTLDNLERELQHLQAEGDVIIQMDVEERHIRRDGTPYADARPRTPRVALAFHSKRHGPMTYYCDAHHTWQENVREFEEWGPLIHQPSRDGTGFMWQVSAKPIKAKRGRRKGKKLKPTEVIGPKHDGDCGWWLQFWRAMRYKVKPLMIRDPKRKGETFRRFVGQLRRLGYQIEHRVLNAADYGVNTIRKRFFMIARRDGNAIVWPTPTHRPMKVKRDTEGKRDSETGGLGRGRGRSGGRESRAFQESARSIWGADGGGGRVLGRSEEKAKGSFSAEYADGAASSSSRRDKGGSIADMLPYRTAAECIDFNLPCPSIFDRKRPLAINTLKRCVKGLVRYLFECADPYIIQVNHGGEEFRGQSVHEPLPTLTQRHGFAFVAPVMTKNSPNDKPFHGVAEPLHTITTIHNRFQMATASLATFITRCAHGDSGRWGHGTHVITDPIPTLTASKDFALTTLTLVPFLMHRYGEAPGQEMRGQSVAEPIRTITPTNNTGVLVIPTITRLRFGEQAATTTAEPLQTICAGGNHFALTTTTMVPFVAGVGGRAGQSLATGADAPLGTITAKNDRAAVMAHLTHFHAEKGNEVRASDLRDPIPTQDTSNRFGVVAASLVEMANSTWSNGTRPVTLPMPTITATPKGGSWAMATAFLTKLRGSAGWRPVTAPLDTICAGAATFCLTTPYITILRNHCDASPLTAPLTTIAANGRHHNLTVPICIKYYSAQEGQFQGVNEPIHTIPATDRFALLAPIVSPLPAQIGRAAEVYQFLMQHKDLIGDPAGVTFYHLPGGRGYVTVRIKGDEYLITDIGLRMLTPRELLRCQFTPELAHDYILPKSNAAAVHKIGNSVPPLVVSALVRANCPDLIVPRKKRRSA